MDSRDGVEASRGREHISRQQKVGARRRAQMRERLISAAARVVAEMGEGRARIEDFISAAGVARGTFYNYYRTREELLDDLWETIGKEPFGELRSLTEAVEDPAERLAIGIRLVLERAGRDHSWGWLVYSLSATSTVPADLMTYPGPDLVIGRHTGRFSFSNLDSASDVIVGTIRAALRAVLEQDRPLDYILSVIVQILKSLGIAEDEAQFIAEHRSAASGQLSPDG